MQPILQGRERQHLLFRFFIPLIERSFVILEGFPLDLLFLMDPAHHFGYLILAGTWDDAGEHLVEIDNSVLVGVQEVEEANCDTAEVIRF